MLPWIPEGAPADAFPPVSATPPEMDGLVAAGGDLSPARLLAAYRRGLFPWYSDGQPILWWSPDPRTVFRPDGIHVSRSLAKELRRGRYHVTWDRSFTEVVTACAEPRNGEPGTWITEDMQLAYQRLHLLGHAHSVEVRDVNESLVGGLYGVAIGTAFFGESMFSRVANASKIALVRLGERLRGWGFELIDAQVGNPHLERMGAEAWPRSRFLERLATAVERPAPTATEWRHEPE